jgi:hypothetical protein
VASVATAPSSGAVGIAEVTFAVAGRGAEALVLSDFQMALRGSVNVTGTFDVARLNIP